MGLRKLGTFLIANFIRYPYTFDIQGGLKGAPRAYGLFSKRNVLNLSVFWEGGYYLDLECLSPFGFDQQDLELIPPEGAGGPY